METAATIVGLVQIWGIIGGCVALVFLTIGIDRIDEDAQGAYVFRPLLIPGILLIWPLVLWRWWQIEAKSAPWLSRYQPVRKRYGLTVLLMTIAIGTTLLLGLLSRQDWPSHIAPQRVSEATE